MTVADKIRTFMKDELPRCKTTNYHSPKKGDLMLYSRYRRGRAVAFPQ
jgi:hypothetical protein